MSTVAEIKAAIDLLSPQERCELEALRPTILAMRRGRIAHWASVT